MDRNTTTLCNFGDVRCVEDKKQRTKNGALGNTKDQICSSRKFTTRTDVVSPGSEKRGNPEKCRCRDSKLLFKNLEKDSMVNTIKCSTKVKEEKNRYEP